MDYKDIREGFNEILLLFSSLERIKNALDMDGLKVGWLANILQDDLCF